MSPSSVRSLDVLSSPRTNTRTRGMESAMRARRVEEQSDWKGEFRI
jgi:hypothetical protein